MSLYGAGPVRGALLALALLSAASQAPARDYLVDPADPAAQVGGPFWPSVAAVLNGGVVEGGDRILLAPGEHAPLVFSNRRYAPPLEIRSSDPSMRARVPGIHLRNVHGVTVAGLDVWPARLADKPDTLVALTHDSSGNVLDDLDIRARADAPETYFDWTRDDWTTTWGVKGVSMDGPDNALTGSRVTGTSFAITTTGVRARVTDNRVAGFSGDGMRGLGDGSLFAGNRLQDCFKVNKNHDDGFQAWAPRGSSAPLSDLTLSGNIIREWTGPAGHPLRCRLQGISLFDGAYANVTIVNNVIAVTAYHGISVYGGEGARILHNTVVHGDALPETHPWIMLSDSKGGRPARDNLVMSNVAMGYRQRTSEPQDMPSQANATIRYPARVLRDVLGGDFRPRPDSGLVDAVRGPAHVPVDLEGTPRPSGAAADLGAYELP